MHSSTAGLVCIQLLCEKRVERLPVFRSSKERAKQSVTESSRVSYLLSHLFEGRRRCLTGSICECEKCQNDATGMGMGGRGSGETKSGNAILRIKPRGCEPCVLAAFFESGKLGVVLVYKSFTVGRDGPAESGLGGFLPQRTIHIGKGSR